jgi:hypothetical protein
VVYAQQGNTSKVTLEYVFVLFAPSWFNLSSYRQGRLIVLYVGCTGEIIETLSANLNCPVVSVLNRKLMGPRGNDARAAETSTDRRRDASVVRTARRRDLCLAQRNQQVDVRNDRFLPRAANLRSRAANQSSAHGAVGSDQAAGLEAQATYGWQRTWRWLGDIRAGGRRGHQRSVEMDREGVPKKAKK